MRLVVSSWGTCVLIIIVGVLFIAIILELVQSKGLPLEALKRAIGAKVLVRNVITRTVVVLLDVISSACLML
jgi:hypothetical protein